ncbi:POK11 protein, partial [Setophaga kirtlandii]|nr:POK11 protein [Setophaga kirtlandii]
FAFSVPSINRQARLKRYQRRTLPQGMKNSPAICQMFVARGLSSIREYFPDAIIFHYVDVILICPETYYYLETVLKKTIQVIEGARFEIATKKIQCTGPWTYLGLWIISQRTIVPQQLTIKDNPKTLRDLHQLCGSISWVHSLLGITTDDLAPLFNLLGGCDDLDSPRTITPEARVAIQKVSEAL